MCPHVVTQLVVMVDCVPSSSGSRVDPDTVLFLHLHAVKVLYKAVIG